MNKRLNENFIELMDKLSNIMSKKGEIFRAKAYQKAMESILLLKEDILKPEDLKGVQYIGNTIMDKLTEYVNTGTLEIIENEKNNPLNILLDIYGIGLKKANELISQGICSIDVLKKNADKLNNVQKIGLKYYEDIIKRIPRTEIEQYRYLFENYISSYKDINTKLEIVGSYRRGAESSGDIDVIITSENPNIFQLFIDKLFEEKIILEILSRGNTKCLVITKLKNSNIARRVDFLYTNKSEFPFALLYFTGSKIFNTVMRNFALEKKLTMNEHGLYSLDNNIKRDKVNHIFKDEKDIFDYLELEYKEPFERTDGRAVIKVSKTPINIADDFKKKGISVLEKMNENELNILLNYANNAYFNKESILSDSQYDILKSYIQNKYPRNQIIYQVGASVEKNKVALPYYMGSMNKIKPDTNSLSNWVAKYNGPYVISAKLDGVSGLYCTENNKQKLYTRGDGIYGQDISYLISHLKLPKIKDLVIRGEFIIPKHIFYSKYKSSFSNPRNMVAGIINSKTINEVINEIKFVAYEVIKPSLKPSKQMELLGKLNIDSVQYKSETNITNDLLSEILINWRENSLFDIDGIIITDDNIYERKDNNPEHSFAFKMVLSEQVAEAIVTDVIWNVSKDGYLKPRVQIEPLILGGVQIQYATGFNGSFILNNKIGIGSIIELIRSGDVIPYIRKVISPSLEGKMPNVPYIWNESKVDIIIENTETDENVLEKNIAGFFRGIGVEGLSEGNIRRLMLAGYKSVPDILNLTINDLMKIEGFKEKLSTKIHNSIKDKINASSLICIMSSSNTFGRGFNEKKIEIIMNVYPDILLSPENNLSKIEKLINIKGIAKKSAELFVERIPVFLEFIDKCNLQFKLINIQKTDDIVDTSNPLYNKNIVMTGFRDKELSDKLKKIGCKVVENVNKKTFLVLIKNNEADIQTPKANEARKLNIPLISSENFKNEYL